MCYWTKHRWLQGLEKKSVPLSASDVILRCPLVAPYPCAKHSTEVQAIFSSHASNLFTGYLGRVLNFQFMCTCQSSDVILYCPVAPHLGKCHHAKQCRMQCRAIFECDDRKADSLAVSLSAFTRDPPLPTGCSLMSTAASETTRGNAAVSRKTPRGPHVSINDPEKYALATPPSAADAQQSDCSEPAVLCRMGISK